MLNGVSVFSLPLVFSGFLLSYLLALVGATKKAGPFFTLLALLFFTLATSGALLLGVALFEVVGYTLPLMIIELLSLKKSEGRG